MTSKSYLNFIYNLYTQAAEDVQPYLPDWVKEHPKIKNLNKLTDIVKKIPLEDFRKPLDISIQNIKIDDRRTRRELIYNLYLDIDSKCAELNNSLNASSVNDNIKNAFIEIIDKILKSFTSRISFMLDDSFKTEKVNAILTINDSIKESFNIETPKGIFPKTIFIPANTSITTACKVLLENIKKYVPDISITSNAEGLSDISALDLYKRFAYLIGKKFKEQMTSLNDNKFEIVFTSNPSDVLAMSNRSDWTSCQNLMINEDSKNVKAIYSAVSPYVGIIYLTNKKDYQSRGEEMVARSLVFYTENKNGEPALVLNKVYTNMDSKIVFTLFQNALNEKSSTLIIAPEVAKTLKYRFPVENEEETPYFDVPIETFKK